MDKRMDVKICNKCGDKKSFEDFHRDSSKKDGLCTFCKDCRTSKPNIVTKKCEVCDKDFNLDGKRKHTLICSDECSSIKKKNYKSNYDLLNKDSINLYKRAWKKNRIENDLTYRLSTSLRERVRSVFKVNKIYKNNKTVSILGCSFEEFKNHIESQFLPWMNSKNYGLYNGEFNYGWDIDHIIPLSSAKTEEDIIRLNHYTNLQPLCSKINREIKRDNLMQKLNIKI